MLLADAGEVTAIHLAAFPGFFLSFLGERFLRELYRSIAVDPDGIAFVAQNGGRIIGFVAGSVSASGFFRRLARRRWWRFAAASLWPFLRRPRIFPRLLRALYAPPRPSVEGAALLMSLAVDPAVQRSGAGRLLTRAFVGEAAARGAVSVVLTTDRDDNDAVNSFYRDFGFTLQRQYVTRERRAMNEYVFVQRK
jgi:ribosomal protein S18 acetylase RimI-like enzyme